MTDAAPVKFGANLWNQYTDWPSWRHAAVEPTGSATTPLDLGPPLSHRRVDDGPMFEAWTASRPGPSDSPHRPHGRRQHVPQPGPGGEDGDHPRPHLGRARHPGDRRRLVRDRAPRLRPRVRQLARGAAALARGGGRDHARHAPRRGAVRGAVLHRALRAERPHAGAGRVAAADRRRRGAEDAADRGPLRGCLQRGRRPREREAQGRDPAPALRRGGARRGGDRAHDRVRASRSSATIRRRRSACFTRIFEHNGGARPWQNQLVGTPEQVADALRPFLGIGFRHFIFGFPAPDDRRPWSA